MQYRNPSNHKGIDIAVYQEGLDFSLVKQAGVDVVYIKATEGVRYINPFLQQHCLEAQAQGMKVGFYHYFWTTLDPTQQMTHFVNTIKNLNLKYECKLALDVEETKGCTAKQVSIAASKALSALYKLTGQCPVIYTYTSFVRSNLLKEYVGAYPLWIADYNTRGIPGSNSVWDNWIGYQFSSKGNIGGITVDLDEFTDDIFLEGGEEGMQKFEDQERVKCSVFGVERSDCVLLEVEGRPTTYVPLISFREPGTREHGDTVRWDQENQKAIIEEAK